MFSNNKSEKSLIAAMESPYISINLDELKRLYPNLNLENVQVVSMGSGVADETQNTQQVVISVSK